MLPDYPPRIQPACIRGIISKFHTPHMHRSFMIDRSCSMFFNLNLITVHDLHMCGTYNLIIWSYLVSNISVKNFKIRQCMQYIHLGQSQKSSYIDNLIIHGDYFAQLPPVYTTCMYTQHDFQISNSTHVQILHNRQILFNLFQS